MKLMRLPDLFDELTLANEVTTFNNEPRKEIRISIPA